MPGRLLICFCALFYTSGLFAQTENFDVFTYQSPEFFTKSELPSRVQFNLTNNDKSFCTITIYKSQQAEANMMKNISSQWNEQVVKRLNKADKKPGRTLTEQLCNSWASTLAIGNFYQVKKKCVVMLNSFRKYNKTVCAVFAFSDKSFKEVAESFSANIHFKK